MDSSMIPGDNAVIRSLSRSMRDGQLRFRCCSPSESLSSELAMRINMLWRAKITYIMRPHGL
jgi:hypothetical protein